MKAKPEALMRDLYNLIINPATRDWERHLLVQAKNNRQQLSPTGQLKQLEADLRPLAMRNNLTRMLWTFILPSLATHPCRLKTMYRLTHPLVRLMKNGQSLLVGAFGAWLSPLISVPVLIM